jgi:dienelactone hydrolase
MNALLLAAALASSPSSQSVDGPFDYPAGTETMEGHLVAPEGKGPHPLVLIVHDWDGLDAYEISRARQTAKELNAVALAVDIYGKTTRPKSTAENGQFAGKYYGDRPLFRSRLKAAYDAGIKLSNVDPNKVIVMGYCFGGAGALELARTGAKLVGAVSFHGGLATSMPAAAGTVTCRVLVFHAANDPAVPREQFNGFLDECRDAKIQSEVHVFNLTAHAFTKPGGRDYSAEGDRRSWKLFKDFYVEVTGS